MKPSLRSIHRISALLPGTFLVLCGLFLSAVLLLYGLLVPDVQKPSDLSSRTGHRVRKLVQTADARVRELQLHVSGPGRARNWESEQIRQFHLVKTIRYTGSYPEVSDTSFTEQRELHQFRFLLLSSAPQERLHLKSGVMDILHSLGSSDKLFPIGQQGYPVGSIEPENLSEQEQNRLMEFIQGEQKNPKAQMNVIRFISPYEGQIFKIRHRIRDGKLHSSLENGKTEISGIERRVLLNAPATPELFLPERMTSSDAGKKRARRQTFHISAIDHYVNAFFNCRLSGSVQLSQTSRQDHSISLRGTGSFNILHPTRPEQIGGLDVHKIELTYDRKQFHITDTLIQGRIVLSGLPDTHVLHRIQFQRKPTFRISYTSRTNTHD